MKTNRQEIEKIMKAISCFDSEKYDTDAKVVDDLLTLQEKAVEERVREVVQEIGYKLVREKGNEDTPLIPWETIQITEIARVLEEVFKGVKK